MPLFIVFVAMFLVAMAASFYPHWSAYLMVPIVVFLLFVANRVRISDRGRSKIEPKAYTHPKMENQNPRTQLNPDPRTGDDSTLQF